MRSVWALALLLIAIGLMGCEPDSPPTQPSTAPTITGTHRPLLGLAIPMPPIGRKIDWVAIKDYKVDTVYLCLDLRVDSLMLAERLQTYSQDAAVVGARIGVMIWPPAQLQLEPIAKRWQELRPALDNSVINSVICPAASAWSGPVEERYLSNLSGMAGGGLIIAAEGNDFHRMDQWGIGGAVGLLGPVPLLPGVQKDNDRGAQAWQGPLATAETISQRYQLPVVIIEPSNPKASARINGLMRACKAAPFVRMVVVQVRDGGDMYTALSTLDKP
jgi:hypothetical protein